MWYTKKLSKWRAFYYFYNSVTSNLCIIDSEDENLSHVISNVVINPSLFLWISRRSSSKWHFFHVISNAVRNPPLFLWISCRSSSKWHFFHVISNVVRNPSLFLWISRRSSSKWHLFLSFRTEGENPLYRSLNLLTITIRIKLFHKLA